MWVTPRVSDSLLIEPLVQTLRDVSVALVDVSSTAIALATRTLGRYPDLPVTGHETTYEDGLRQAVATRSGDDTILVAFLGSNFGNLDPAEALRVTTGEGGGRRDEPAASACQGRQGQATSPGEGGGEGETDNTTRQDRTGTEGRTGQTDRTKTDTRTDTGQ